MKSGEVRVACPDCQGRGEFVWESPCGDSVKVCGLCRGARFFTGENARLVRSANNRGALKALFYVVLGILALADCMILAFSLPHVLFGLSPVPAREWFFFAGGIVFVPLAWYLFKIVERWADAPLAKLRKR